MNKLRGPKPADILTFREPGRLLDVAGLSGEFRLMKEQLNDKAFTVQVAERVCKKKRISLIENGEPSGRW